MRGGAGFVRKYSPNGLGLGGTLLDSEDFKFEMVFELDATFLLLDNGVWRSVCSPSGWRTFLVLVKTGCGILLIGFALSVETRLWAEQCLDGEGEGGSHGLQIFVGEGVAVASLPSEAAVGSR